MKVLSANEVKDRFGLDADQVDLLERDAAVGTLHGEPCREVMRGRPFLFGEEMRQVGFKEPASKVEAIDRRAQKLGMKRSDYLRFLVDADLRLAGELAEDGTASAGRCAVKVLKGVDAEDFRARWKKRDVFGNRRGDRRAAR